MKQGYKKIRLTTGDNIATYSVHDWDAVQYVQVFVYSNGSEKMMLHYIDGVRILNSPLCDGDVMAKYTFTKDEFVKFKRYTDLKYSALGKYNAMQKCRRQKIVHGRKRFLRYDYYRAIAVQEYSNFDGIMAYTCDDNTIRVVYDGGITMTYNVNEGERQLKEVIKSINKRLGGIE